MKSNVLTWLWTVVERLERQAPLDLAALIEGCDALESQADRLRAEIEGWEDVVDLADSVQASVLHLRAYLESAATGWPKLGRPCCTPRRGPTTLP